MNTGFQSSSTSPSLTLPITSRRRSMTKQEFTIAILVLSSFTLIMSLFTLYILLVF